MTLEAQRQQDNAMNILSNAQVHVLDNDDTTAMDTDDYDEDYEDEDDEGCADVVNHGVDDNCHNFNEAVIPIPRDVLMQIGDSYLNPRERSRLATCSRQFHNAFPSLLRIKIVNSQGDGSLKHEFFVSTSTNPNQPLHSHQMLRYGDQYYFWTFDYLRGNKVYLGRHTRHGHKEHALGSTNPAGEELSHLYSLGLRPRTPNQTWEVVGGKCGDFVKWGRDVGLLVGGKNDRARQPDSDQRGLLSCLPTHAYAFVSQGGRRRPSHNWCVISDEWGKHEKLQLIPQHAYVPKCGVKERQIPLHAIPEICDEGEYLLHTPASLRDGDVTCLGYHINVEFHYWIHSGVMYFHAPVLPHSLAIPILRSDKGVEDFGEETGTSAATCPIVDIWRCKSARWGCVIYYMAVAADVSEGKILDMNRFLTRITDHEDHVVRYSESDHVVYIDVNHKEPRTDVPNVARNPLASWIFTLCW